MSGASFVGLCCFDVLCHVVSLLVGVVVDAVLPFGLPFCVQS